MPLYEYACRGCGERVEQMRKQEDRLKGPACPACGGATSLAMSAPGRVGTAAGAGAAATSHGCGPGCCGGACATGSA